MQLAPSLLAATADFSVDEVLGPYIYVFYAAFIVAFVFTPVMRSVATYYGIIDRPDRLRKIHSQPVAYLGGVAVFLGWIAGLAVSQLTVLHDRSPGVVLHPRVPLAIVFGACLIVALGFWDDVRQIRPRWKIAGQIAAAGVLLLSGVGTTSLHPILGSVNLRLEVWTGWQIPLWLETIASCAFTVAVVVFCCNATNLMDGLDGLCGGVTAVIAAGFLFLSVYLATLAGSSGATWAALLIVLSLALLGSVLGFVPYNFNPASIFLGDTGSMLLGFAISTLIVLMAEVDSRWLLASLVMFALPVLDTSLAFARRYVAKRPFFSADRHHFHHQLVARGLSIRKTVVISYLLAIGFVLLGSSIVFMRTRYAIAIYLVVFGSIIVAAYKMGMVHEKPVVVTRRPIGEAGAASGADVAEIEAAAVLEIRDPRQTERPTLPDGESAPQSGRTAV